MNKLSFWGSKKESFSYDSFCFLLIRQERAHPAFPCIHILFVSPSKREKVHLTVICRVPRVPGLTIKVIKMIRRPRNSHYGRPEAKPSSLTAQSSPPTQKG
jgi:hypothetical protein